jgi:hypothetical protein
LIGADDVSVTVPLSVNVVGVGVGFGVGVVGVLLFLLPLHAMLITNSGHAMMRLSMDGGSYSEGPVSP